VGFLPLGSEANFMTSNMKVFEFPAKNSDHPARMHQLYAVDYRKRFIASETVPLNKTIMFAKFRVVGNALAAPLCSYDEFH
jgi:hypothetical protein